MPLRHEPEDFDRLVGSSQGTLTYYLNSLAPEVTVAAPPFEVVVHGFDFDPCQISARLGLNQFYPESETYIMDEDFTQDMPFIQGCWRATFSEYKSTGSSDSAYVFPLELHNGSEEAAKESIDAVDPKSQGKVVETFEITLIHTPKRVN